MAPKFNRAQAVAALRDHNIFVFEDDGVTPAPIDSPFKGVHASRALNGATGATAGVVLSYVDVGTTGNTYSVAFTADGAGAGSVTAAGNALTFHFQSGITTIANAIAQLSGYGILFSGTFSAGAALTSPGDVFTGRKLAGGVNAAIFIRSGGTTWLVYEGIWTNTGIPGDWIYQYTIGELDFIGSEVALRVTADLTPGYLDLSTKTIRVGTIVYDKFAALDYEGGNPYGNKTSLQFIADGAGAGNLDESAYPVIVFHYASATTTVQNFEDAVVASTKLGIKKYGKWTNVITAAGDTFAATFLGNGRGYKQEIYPAPMEYGDGNSLVRGSNTLFDTIRGIEALVIGVKTGYNTPVITVKNPDGSKTCWTVSRDNTGVLVVTQVDLTGP